ncbi:hypothetical protein QUG_1454 [Clostridioides difficile P53]|nr:hypothetical protein QUA_1592 [Clostridioides difficile P49]ERM48379.1 hypothetical protein QUG_1454 [Clostridioides difficile P53]
MYNLSCCRTGTGFILTIWNVNQFLKDTAIIKNTSFILTIWNVN